ncbi:CLUMA_CG004290, isoform A [Clunio marinus]|uniref:Tenascin-like protein n=1 Tax=Clunio marinus TaxID=568069 RepID=A0A1J1HT83_9DIPT|nr:CLUMA_CG004290, isoform A [Clunio marinus]
MTMKSTKYQECDTIMDNCSPVPPPLPRRVVPNRNIYAEPFETSSSRLGTLQSFNSSHQSSSSQGMSCTNNPHLGGNFPLVMPDFPVTTSQFNQGSHHSPYTAPRLQVENSSCQQRCSWKCLSIALIILSIVLATLVAYFATVSSIKPNMDPSSCILVQDVKASQSLVNPILKLFPTEDSLQISNVDHTTSYQNHHQTYQDQQQIQTPLVQSSIMELKDFNILHQSTTPPYQFWNIDFRNKHPAFVNIYLNIPWGANFAVYGRRNVLPSITQYDFFEFVKGGRLDQGRIRNERDVANDEDVKAIQNFHHHFVSKRSSSDAASKFNMDTMMVNVTISQYLDGGRWYLAIFNDDLVSHQVQLILSEAETVSSTCMNDCSGHGSCYLGKCDCIDGYEGVDCSKSVCPVLCSAHGHYGGGICHCEEGWKGSECDIPVTECEMPTCSSHGRCIEGECHCNRGWKGRFCDQVDCQDPTCSEHGSCVSGQCFCKAGWQGENCETRDQQVYQCLPGCSDHGHYDLETGSCNCDHHWTGHDCSQAICSLDCGPNGICESSRCRCNPGWTGVLCDQLTCDVRCSTHGQCKNGTCVCSQGWNGKYCTLPGCENGCSRHGHCTLDNSEYRCECVEGWAGTDCSIPLETNCNDNIDNDKDGMTDCSDSECCSHPVCSEHIMCLSSNDPVEVLLRKQPPSVTASFYQRVKFLIEDNSVQSYAHKEEYSERFDILVNGGGAITLQFQRSPFHPLTRTVFVPWNQIIVLPPVQMILVDESESEMAKVGMTMSHRFLNSLRNKFYDRNFNDSSVNCPNSDMLRPILTSTWMPNAIGSKAGQSLIFAENQIVQESLQVPGSGIYLTYHSMKMSGYLSIVHMQLTGSEIPKTLTHVHVGVEIEGSLHVKTYEADPNLQYIFAWNKRNVYKQKVYGAATAKISIGYQQSTCNDIIWETQTAKLQGFDVDISDIGGWGLNIHHHYNFHEGILQKGDGATLHFKEYPRVVTAVMGNGQQRPLKCKDKCNGVAKTNKLLTPIALASGPDGSLYVGDFNLVRRIFPNQTVVTVAQLSATQVSYQYYLTVSPADGHLYISDPEKYQVLKVTELANNSMEAVVGSGHRCIPGDEEKCGDGGLAKNARLSHPKGIAIAADKTIYIADGTSIRAVDNKGIIHTLIGHHGHHNHWSPIPCKGTLFVNQVQLQWPTGLSLNPIDGSLHFIDDRLVLKLTVDMKIKVVAGQPLHCANNNMKNETNDDLVLGTVLAMAFSPLGDLFVADSDSRRVNSIRVVDTAGNMKTFAGQKDGGFQACDCRGNTTKIESKRVTSSTSAPVLMMTPMTGCVCPSTKINIDETVSSTNMRFSAISALAVTQDNVLNVADQGLLQILALQHYLPKQDKNIEYQIPYPPTNEIYIFNRYGQHVATKDMSTGKTIYSFLYSKNTSFGKLSAVTDITGNKIQFLRDYSSLVSSIENTQDHKLELKFSTNGFLTRLSDKGKSETVFDYDENGLILSRSTDSETFIYQYNKYGRVINVIVPTGETLKVSSHLNADYGLQVDVQSTIPSSFSSKTLNIASLKFNGGIESFIMERDKEILKATIDTNNTLSIFQANKILLQSSAIIRHPSLEKSSLKVEAEMLPMWSHETIQMGDTLLNSMYTTYTLIGADPRNPHQTLKKEIWVNNTRTLGVRFEQLMNSETFYDRDHQDILSVTYDSNGLPLSYKPANGFPLNISYDRFNRVESLSWGPSELKYSYERHGLLSEITSQQDGIVSYTYNDFNLLSEIGLASQRKIQITYDSNGGVRSVLLPTGSKHLFDLQRSFGFVRFTYTPPGSSKSYLQHFSYSGALLQTIYPGNSARIVYRYNEQGKLLEIVHGEGKSEFNYNKETGMLSTVAHAERELEYRWDYEYNGALLTEERIDFIAKTGLSNAKFTYEYDSNFRLISSQGRIGGKNLPGVTFAYSSKTGNLEQISQFKVSHPKANMTNIYDGTATFTRTVDGRFLETETTLYIHRMQVFKMEFSHDMHGRIKQTKMYTRNVAVTNFSNIKNYTWDCDGQLVGVEAQEPWGFRYDDNGNMLALSYRGNDIPMEYNSMDRIIKFAEGHYKYDSRGHTIQNAREEKFHYSTQGLLVRAFKKGRFDVRYFYDHLDRLSVRKDNFGNVTQFFYNNQDRTNEVSQIYSPRDGKLLSLVYDDRGHLIFVQVFRNKYYVATDQSGTPIMIFNQYGEGIREMMRSPFGHIVYDSNPYLYLPIDFCGGILDPVTSLVHMPDGKIYDPLIGLYMTPNWKNTIERIKTPTKLHQYRFNGNDPVNVNRDRSHPKDFESWFNLIGFNLKNMFPQFNKRLWKSSSPLGVSVAKQQNPLIITSGFLSHLIERQLPNNLPSPKKSSLKLDELNLPSLKAGASSEPPFGKGIIVVRTFEGQAIVSSVPAANAIYRDVYTSVFNRTKLLPFTFVAHNSQQDSFYFVKEDSWRSSEDRQQLKRLQGQVNTTFHENNKENSSGNNNYLDVKIHGIQAVINLRYGTTLEKEKQRLMHHAKLQVMRKAWSREKELIRAGLTTSVEWVQSEIEEIIKQGYSNLYDCEYFHDVNIYPELAEDPSNIRFTKKKVRSKSRR